VNGAEEKQYAEIVDTFFSPDSGRFAYVAFERIKSDQMNFAVIDGAEGKHYEIVDYSIRNVSPVIFSPDSKHTAYQVGAPENYVVRDGVPEKSYAAIEKALGYGSTECVPVFSPDSKRLAYVACIVTNWTVIVDGKIFDDQHVREFTHNLVFSPDSQHLAYRSRLDAHWFAIVDGVVLKQSKDVFSNLYFSPNGKRLAFLIQRGDKVVLCYGEFEGKEYDKFLTCDPFLNTQGTLGELRVPVTFDKNGDLHTVVLRGDEILRLEFEIVEE
jgi:Tol biopolymer transport system component